MAKNIRTIKDGETVSRERKVLDENRVQATYGILEGSKDKGTTYVVDDAIFDFSNVTREELLLLATARCVIAVQTRLRKVLNGKSADRFDAKHYNSINVKMDIVDAERASAAGKTTFEKAEGMIAKLSEEEKKKLLALLGETK